MTFTFRQLQEKCKEHQQDLYAVFIDLSKAFDSVHRPGLWAILGKIGCPAALVDIIRSFHDGMRASVIENGERLPEFDVSNGTKQGCGLAPLLFCIFFSMMLLIAFQNTSKGIPYGRRSVQYTEFPGTNQGPDGDYPRSAVRGRLCASHPHLARHTGAVRPFC